MTKSKRKLVCFFFGFSLCLSLSLGKSQQDVLVRREKNSKKIGGFLGVLSQD